MQDPKLSRFGPVWLSFNLLGLFIFFLLSIFILHSISHHPTTMDKNQIYRSVAIIGESMILINLEFTFIKQSALLIFQGSLCSLQGQFLIQMDQLPSKLHRKVKRSAAQQNRIMVDQLIRRKIIARNQRDGVQKDFSLLKKKCPTFFQQCRDSLYNTKPQIQDKPLIEQRQLHKKRLAVYGLAQAKMIMLDYPDIMRQSIEYLTNLAEQPQLSALTKNAVNKSSITQYYTRLFTKGATSAFYKHSTALLNNRILEIIQEFHKSQLQYPPQMNIQIQILAHFLKIVLQFQRYIPRYVSTHTLHLNMTCFGQVLNLTTEQISQLRRIYLQNSHRITYLEGFPLRPLVNAYYFIILKQKVLSVSYSFQLEDDINKAIKQLKIHRAQTIEKEKFNTEFKGEEDQGFYSLSELYARRQISKKGKAPSGEELLQRISTYERYIALQSQIDFLGHEEIKKMAQWEEVDYDDFKRYQRRKRKLLEKYGYNLSKLKDEFLTKQLIRNPYCSYEEMFSNVCNRNALYVERNYFEGNVHRLLEKEAHYQQLNYLEKVFRGTIQCTGKANVIFIDRCSLIEGRESSAIVTVSLAGALQCKIALDSLNILKEVKELLRVESSVVFLYDDEFPFSGRLEKTEESFLIRKSHSLYFLPRVSMVPNPCMVIANSIKQMLTKQCSLEEAIQIALEEFDGMKVMNVAQKEWEKAQRLAYHDNLLCNQQSETNNDERAYSNIEESSGDQDNQEEEDKNKNEEIKFLFLRQNKEGFSTPNPQPLIMENLSKRSVSDLQLSLTRLLQLNKISSIPKNP